MRSHRLIAALALSAVHAAAAGEIYRCIDAQGAVSYTNIACPEKTRVEHVASYVPDDSVPPTPVDDTVARAAEDSAAQAREAALQAREAALQARIASEVAREQEAAAPPPLQETVYSPDRVPVYVPPATRLHGRHGGRHDRVIHIQGPETPVQTPHWAAPADPGRAPRAHGGR